jgi:putative OPT family oligopeptide transporter
VCSVVGSAAAISNDTIQDLKAGQMVGATPWKQQLMLIIGVVTAALIIPLVLQLLFEAYGISGVYPRPGMDPAQMLAAPQASLMAALAQGVFTYHLPWGMISAGGVIAVIAIMVDRYLMRKGTRLPVLAVGLGIYLPLSSSMPVIIGGILAYWVERRLKQSSPQQPVIVAERQQRGLLIASGMVAGAALMGVLLAIPFAMAKSTAVLSIVSAHFKPTADALGVIITVLLLSWIYYMICRAPLPKR